jgi:large subunit ribosomal protein L4
MLSNILANQRQGTQKLKKELKLLDLHVRLKTKKKDWYCSCGAKNPLFKGGGTVFGPRPSYSFKLNKNLKRLARKSAFQLKKRVEHYRS